MIELPLARIEGAHLAGLVDEFRDLLGSERNEADPAIARLTPNPYPGDTPAARDFAESTADDLLARRLSDAAVVGAALSDFDGTPDALSEEEALAPRTVVIADAELDAWLRTLTAIRLVIATRLGIVDDDRHDPDDARYGVYDWLGYRLDGILQAADDED